MAKNNKKNNNNQNDITSTEEVITEKELLESMQEIKQMQQDLIKEKQEFALEKEAFRLEKENIEKELKKQQKSVELTKDLDKKDFAEARRTAEILKQDMVKIKIPVDKSNKDDLLVPVTINGYTWTIKRGEQVEVPQEVYNLLEQADYI